MDNKYETERTTMFSSMTSFRFRGEKDMYSNGTTQRSPGFKEKYVIKSLHPFNEDKFALLIFYFSLSLVVTKILYVYRELLYSVFSMTSSLPSFDSNVFLRLQTGLLSLWAAVSEFNWIIVPVLIGLLSSYIMWRTVYLDSRIPGVEPPTLFSQSTKWYHMGYGLAIYIGILAFFMAFFSWNSFIG